MFCSIRNGRISVDDICLLLYIIVCLCDGLFGNRLSGISEINVRWSLAMYHI